MQRPAERQELNDDGTPRRKYELYDVDESRLWFRMSLGTVLASAVILVKNLMFGSKPRHEDDALANDRDERNSHSQESEFAVASENESASNSATDTADDLIKTFKNSLVPAADHGDWKSVANDAVTKLADVPRGQTNDNVPLYGASPGYSVTLPQAESGSPYAGHMGRAIDPGDGGSFAAFKIVQTSELPTPTVTPKPLAPPSDVVDPGKDRAANRLPVSSGTLNLGSLLMNSTIILALSDLLRNASDPDGDTLTVSNFHASSGAVAVGTDGVIRFTPMTDDSSGVTFTFAISDGEGSIQQTAYLDLLPVEVPATEGTPRSDVLIGTPNDDVIVALAGDDTILGREGNDIIYAGDGNDRIIAGDGNDIVYAGAGNDIVYAGAGNDVVFGDAGNDVIFGEAGRDALYGGDGDDTIGGGDDDDTIGGEIGNDILIGDAGNDVASGGIGNDTFVATAHSSTLPPTTFTASTSSHPFSAASTSHTSAAPAVASAPAASATAPPIEPTSPANSAPATALSANAFLVEGDASSETFTVLTATAAAAAGITNIADGAEIIITRNGVDNASVVAELKDVSTLEIATGNGDDQVTLEGDFGSTLMCVVDGGGSDTLDVAAFTSPLDVSFYSGGDDHVVDEADRIDLVRIDDGDDIYDGGEGIDTYDMSSAMMDADVDLAAGTATSEDTGHDQLFSIENVITGSGDDCVVGTGEANEIATGGGSDAIAAGGGDDSVSAGASDDLILAGVTPAAAAPSDGDDVYNGGDGADTYDLSAATSDAVVDLAAGTSASDDTGHDRLISLENVITGAGNDEVTGTSEANEIATGDGSDAIAAGGGDDSVSAGAGDDLILAGDTPTTAPTDGNDIYDGGDGIDTYDISALVADAIVDLASGTATSEDVGFDILESIENIVCGDGNDIVIASNDQNDISGGAGEDLFVFRSSASIGYGRGSRDKIMDFDVGDRLNLDDILNEFATLNDTSNTGSVNRPAFDVNFIGATEEFTRPGELRLRYDDLDGVRGNVLLEGNTDYDTHAEFELEFLGDIDELATILAQSFLNQTTTSQY